MQTEYPTVEELMSIDQHRTTEENAKLALSILQAKDRDELEAMPLYDVYYQRVGRQMYNPHDLEELKMQMCNIALDLYGVEGFETRHDGWLTYINVGDPYIATITYFDGAFDVCGYGDIQEKYGAKGDDEDIAAQMKEAEEEDD